MSNPVFFVDPQRITQPRIRIDGDEGRHAATVKRLRIGEIVDVCDGLGNRATGQICELGKDFVEVYVVSFISEPRSSVTFGCAQALAKGERADLALEILTEVGIEHIYPWQAQHSIAKWDESKSWQKWKRVVREASKQARRSLIPTVHPVCSTSKLCEVISQSSLALVLHETGEESLAEVELPNSGDVTIVVGPEGGISSGEIDSFREAGARIVRLGPTILRTSTAGGIALGILASKTNAWQESLQHDLRRDQA